MMRLDGLLLIEWIKIGIKDLNLEELGGYGNFLGIFITFLVSKIRKIP